MLKGRCVHSDLLDDVSRVLKDNLEDEVIYSSCLDYERVRSSDDRCDIDEYERCYRGYLSFVSGVSGEDEGVLRKPEYSAIYDFFEGRLIVPDRRYEEKKDLLGLFLKRNLLSSKIVQKSLEDIDFCRGASREIIKTQNLIHDEYHENGLYFALNPFEIEL